jgi:hypothetical protein
MDLVLILRLKRKCRYIIHLAIESILRWYNTVLICNTTYCLVFQKTIILTEKTTRVSCSANIPL